MARYQHVATGARVEVRDDKVMDSSWEPVKEKAPARKPAAKKSDDKS